MLNVNLLTVNHVPYLFTWQAQDYSGMGWDDVRGDVDGITIMQHQHSPQNGMSSSPEVCGADAGGSFRSLWGLSTIMISSTSTKEK